MKNTILFAGSRKIDKLRLVNYITNVTHCNQKQFQQKISEPVINNVVYEEENKDKTALPDIAWNIETKYYTAETKFLITNIDELDELAFYPDTVGAVVYVFEPHTASFKIFKAFSSSIQQLDPEVKLCVSLPASNATDENIGDRGPLDQEYEDFCLGNEWEFVDYQLCADNYKLQNKITPTDPSIHKSDYVAKYSIALDDSKIKTILDRVSEALVSTLWMDTILNKNKCKGDKPLHSEGIPANLGQPGPKNPTSIGDTGSEWSEFQEYTEESTDATRNLPGTSGRSLYKGDSNIYDLDDLGELDDFVQHLSGIREQLQQLPREERLEKAEKLTIEFVDKFLKD